MPMSPYILVLAQTSHEGAKYVRRAKLPRGRWRVVGKASSIRGIRKAQVHCLPGFHVRPDKHSILAVLRYAQCDWVDVEMPPREVPDAVDQGDGMGEQLSIDEIEALEVVAEVAEIAEAAWDLGCGHFDSYGDPTHNCSNWGRADLSARTLEVAYRYNRLLDRAAHEAYLETILEPEGWEPPASLDAEQILRLAAGESGADVAPMEDREAPKAKRRRKCAECGTLHFKDEPCTRLDGVEETPVADLATMFD